MELVLEAAGLDGAMHAALLRRARLPPPTAGTDGLAGRDRAGARSAADRRVALRVQRMHGDVVVSEVVPDLVFGPLGERVELEETAVVVVDLDLADVRTARPLVAAQSGDPGVEPRERSRQRLHLADVAAEKALLDRVAEQVRAVTVDEALDLQCVGRQQLEPETRVALA